MIDVTHEQAVEILKSTCEVVMLKVVHPLPAQCLPSLVSSKQDPHLLKDIPSYDEKQLLENSSFEDEESSQNHTLPIFCPTLNAGLFGF